MKTHTYLNYEEYVEKQTKAFHLKHSRNWVHEVELGLLANYVLTNWFMPDFAICHGARNGFEVERLRQFFAYEGTVIGTDIGEWAKKIENMIKWDFHKMNEEWRDKADLIYSNSLDHAYNPEEAVGNWLQCLSARGILAVHWAHSHEKGEAKDVDCFIATQKEYLNLLAAAGTVVDQVPIKILKGGCFFIVKRR